MATKLVTFTHTISGSGNIYYEKYDKLAFDLSGLHSYATTYSLTAYCSFAKYTYGATTFDVDLGLKAYTGGSSPTIGGTSTTTIRATVSVPQNNNSYLYTNVTFTYNSASNQSSVWDKPFYICNYAVVNNGNFAFGGVPTITQVVRKYTIPVPAAGDKITHADLKPFSTWCNFIGTVNHTTTNTDIKASESNRPWGTSARLTFADGSSYYTTDSSVAVSAGTKINATYISNLYSGSWDHAWTN